MILQKRSTRRCMKILNHYETFYFGSDTFLYSDMLYECIIGLKWCERYGFHSLHNKHLPVQIQQ